MPILHDLRIDETLVLRGHGEVRVTLRQKSGRLVRLEIAAPHGVMIEPDDEGPVSCGVGPSSSRRPGENISPLKGGKC